MMVFMNTAPRTLSLKKTPAISSLFFELRCSCTPSHKRIVHTKFYSGVQLQCTARV